MCFLQYRVEHRRESAWRAVDDAQHLGSCGLLLERLVTLGFALSKLTLQIGHELLGIGEHAVGRRAHLRTSSGPTFRADHTVIDTGCHRSPIGTVSRVSANDRYRARPRRSIPSSRMTAHHPTRPFGGVVSNDPFGA